VISVEGAQTLIKIFTKEMLNFIFINQRLSPNSVESCRINHTTLAVLDYTIMWALCPGRIGR
jgi:hypothetical protein